MLTNGILRLLEGEGVQVGDIKVRQLGGNIYGVTQVLTRCQRLEQARNPLKLKFSRVDPLGEFLSLASMSKTRLPGELVRDIFGRLDIFTLW